MSDKSERLFEALSELKDSTIDQGAQEPPAKKKFHWRRWTCFDEGKHKKRGPQRNNP